VTKLIDEETFKPKIRVLPSTKAIATASNEIDTKASCNLLSYKTKSKNYNSGHNIDESIKIPVEIIGSNKITNLMNKHLKSANTNNNEMDETKISENILSSSDEFSIESTFSNSSAGQCSLEELTENEYMQIIDNLTSHHCNLKKCYSQSKTNKNDSYEQCSSDKISRKSLAHANEARLKELQSKYKSLVMGERPKSNNSNRVSINSNNKEKLKEKISDKSREILLQSYYQTLEEENNISNANYENSSNRLKGSSSRLIKAQYEIKPKVKLCKPKQKSKKKPTPITSAFVSITKPLIPIEKD
jgi:hypothetical protein